jgi:hypothetical protein
VNCLDDSPDYDKPAEKQERRSEVAPGQSRSAHRLDPPSQANALAHRLQPACRANCDRRYQTGQTASAVSKREVMWASFARGVRWPNRMSGHLSGCWQNFDQFEALSADLA